MAGYPKPEGFKGGPDGDILRQGSAGHVSINPNTTEGEKAARAERGNELDFEYADFGSSYAGQCDPVDQVHDDDD